MTSFKIYNRNIGKNSPTYFIADIAANHDGSLNKAIDLIYSSAEAGADAVKFQNFQAKTIVSKHGFDSLKGSLSHQKTWEKSVFEVYKEAELPLEWTERLRDVCKKVNVDYFTSPYSLEIVDNVTPFVDAWKVGSGDATWHEIIEKMAKTDKPIIIATGACSLDDVKLAVSVAKKYSNQIGLLQCNTNYTANKDESREASLKRMLSINLKVLQTYNELFPEVVTGLSDHTIGHTTVVGAVGLFDARIIEKHYTLDNSLVGPDHAFSMCPKAWRTMVNSTREVEGEVDSNMSFEKRMEIIRPFIDEEELLSSLGDGVKKIEDNEKETYIVQRRAICAKGELSEGCTLTQDNLFPLRPQLPGSFVPYQINELIGKTLKNNKQDGEVILLEDILE